VFGIYLRFVIFGLCTLLAQSPSTPPSATSLSDRSKPLLASQPATGDMISNLTGRERVLFRRGQEAFDRSVSVQGDSIVPDTEAGLGPYFNATSCFSCHAHPASGGSSPAINPQIRAATDQGATNRIPSFLHNSGPVLQARRKFNSDGRRDGSVIPLFTIAGRKDASSCTLKQIDLDAENARGNLSFRIPTPLFGLGLIEAIPDSTIQENQTSNRERRRSLGIRGKVNRIGESGSVTRFGWKAQVLSVEEFAAEAYLMEQGVTNSMLPQKYLNPPSKCIYNALPEDHTDMFASTVPGSLSNVSLVGFFIRFLAPPLLKEVEVKHGQQLFMEIGCDVCHTPTMRTGRSSFAALSEQDVNLYSDLLLHHMGAKLADDIVQGQAGPDEFRTAPLWGLGSRLFFLHDGRARDLDRAIEDHFDVGAPGVEPSEANRVIEEYHRLTPNDRAEILRFLRFL
jgi:CxxC motif-containing protein (DUF1111 family)